MNRIACVRLLLAVIGTVACPVGQAHALDPFCGMVVTENVTFTSDHSCSGNGLIVAADKVTIDLGGFTLSGDGGPLDMGIQIGSHTGVKIKNGTIRGFGDGIRTTDFVTRATKLTLTGVIVRDNANFGAVLAADGILIANSAFIANANTGLLIIECSKVKVTASTVLGNVHTGLEINSASKVALSTLVVAENLIRGVAFVAALDSSLRSSTIMRNGIGVYVGSTDSDVSKNTIAGNTLHGIYVEGSVGASMLGSNLVAGNGGSGIYIGTFSTGSTLKRNQLLGNDVDGITIIAAANATTVNGNTASGNREDGIAILNTAAVLSKNVANANRGRGIRVNGAASDGGGNRGRGNGPTEQCSPAITCPSPFKSKSGSTVPTCGMQVSTSITLAADMPLCSSGDGMEVIADGVTIDLNGHMLRGNRVTGQRGILVRDGRTDVTIKNGIVQGFDVGVALAGAGHTLDNVEARDSLTDGAFVTTSGVTIKNSSFAQNTRHGLFLGDAPTAKVSSSFFAANFGDGLQTFGPNGTFSTLTIGANTVSGVHTRGDAGATFKTLVSAGNLFAGVFVEGNAGVAIAKSTVAGNGPGILVEEQTTNALITSTTSIGNSGYGVDIDAAVPTTITKNITSGNAAGGINVGDNALAPSVAQNKAFGNGGNGIQNTSVATTLTKNIADGNHDVGILTVLGATDGGGNKARHNLSTDCSLPLVCS